MQIFDFLSQNERWLRLSLIRHLIIFSASQFCVENLTFVDKFSALPIKLAICN